MFFSPVNVTGDSLLVVLVSASALLWEALTMWLGCQRVLGIWFSWLVYTRQLPSSTTRQLFAGLACSQEVIVAAPPEHL